MLESSSFRIKSLFALSRCLLDASSVSCQDSQPASSVLPTISVTSDQVPISWNAVLRCYLVITPVVQISLPHSSFPVLKSVCCLWWLTPLSVLSKWCILNKGLVSNMMYGQSKCKTNKQTNTQTNKQTKMLEICSSGSLSTKITEL
jgi:hypothetical protein